MQKKRKPRKGIELGKRHPLTEHGYKGFVRTKFCTPFFGGKYVPECPKDDFDVFGPSEEDKLKSNQMAHLSK